MSKNKKKPGKLRLKKQTLAALDEQKLTDAKGGMMIGGGGGTTGGGGTSSFECFSVTVCGPTSGHPICTLQHNRRANKLR